MVQSDGTYVAYIGVGSNMGDRLKYCQQAILKLVSSAITVTKVSSLYETDPVDYTQQDKFYNAVIQIKTTCDPYALLRHLQQIERELGKNITIPKGPRTIDLDILFYQDRTINDSDLVIPHPSALKRLFVIIPMAEIAPDFCPACAAGKNMAEIASSIIRDASCLPATTRICGSSLTPAGVGLSAMACAVRKVFDPVWAGWV